MHETIVALGRQALVGHRPLAAVPRNTFERPFRSRQRPFAERALRAAFIVIAGGASNYEIPASGPETDIGTRDKSSILTSAGC